MERTPTREQWQVRLSDDNVTLPSGYTLVVEGHGSTPEAAREDAYREAAKLRGSFSDLPTPPADGS